MSGRKRKRNAWPCNKFLITGLHHNRVGTSGSSVSLEYNMKTTSVLVRRSGALAVAVLTLSFAFGGPNAVRAEDPETSPSILREMVFVPVMRAVQGLEQRLSSLEATIASFAQSITSERIVARQLCVSDDSGAQTCLTKAHLDALLKNQVHAEAQQPSIVLRRTSPAMQLG